MPAPKKYGDAANLPVSAMKKKTVSSALKASGGGSGSKVHKPHLDEMHGPESLPYRENQSAAVKAVRQHQPDHPADGFAAVGAGVRAGAEVDAAGCRGDGVGGRRGRRRSIVRA